MVDWICNYYATVGEMPVRSLVQPGYLAPQMPTEAPEEGESFDAIMRDVDTKVMPGKRDNSGSRAYGVIYVHAPLQEM